MDSLVRPSQVGSSRSCPTSGSHWTTTAATGAKARESISRRGARSCRAASPWATPQESAILSNKEKHFWGHFGSTTQKAHRRKITYQASLNLGLMWPSVVGTGSGLQTFVHWFDSDRRLQLTLLLSILTVDHELVPSSRYTRSARFVAGGSEFNLLIGVTLLKFLLIIAPITKAQSRISFSHS